MERARDELFAAARFAGDQHRSHVGREPPDDAEQLLHHRRAADHAAERRIFGNLLFGLEQPLAAMRFLPHRLQQAPQAAEVERLRQIVNRPELDRLDRAVDRGVAAHEHHLAIGIGVADGPKHVDAADIRQAEVDDCDVGVLVLQLVDGAGAVGARDDAEPGIPGEARDYVQHRRLVVDDQNGRKLDGGGRLHGFFVSSLIGQIGWIRRLGGYRWNLLHRLIYFTSVFAVIHYWWKVKLDVTDPMFYAAIVAVLLSVRLFRWLAKRQASATARTAPART